RLQPQVGAGLLERGLDVPAPAVMADDRLRAEGRLGGVEELVAVGAGTVAHEHEHEDPRPEDRRRRLRGDGQRLPVAAQAHGYSMNTNDGARRRFLSMPNRHDYWKKALPQREKWLKPAPRDASPWMFETAKGKWNRLRTGTAAPESGYGDTLLYLP